MSKTKVKEPAKVGYFFGEGYRDLWCTIESAWIKNIGDIKKAWADMFQKQSNVYATVCIFIYRLFMLLSIAVFGTLFTTVFTVLHILGLAVVMLFVYLGFVLLRGVDALFCLFKGISNNCYNPGCERKFTLPVYICPHCGAQHRHLVPSKYGIFYRTCKCGTKLPTTFLNGRQKLESLCPHCGCKAIGGMHKSYLIPVVGGANAGKTCFITMAINEIEKKAPSLGLNYEYQYVQGDMFKDNMKRIESGECPQKTNDTAFKYYNFMLKPDAEKINNLVSVCDIAGEVFANQETLGKQQGYRFADAVMMVVDPLSVEEYRSELKKNLSESEFNNLNGSTQPMGDILSGLINTMENMYRLKANQTVNKTVVVVFTKCDIKGLDEKIGETAIKEYAASHPEAGICEASNAVCEGFLTEYGEVNFVNTICNKFKSVQYFTCSALGHDATGEKFTPENVETPLLWIIDKMSSEINLDSVWGKKI